MDNKDKIGSLQSKIDKSARFDRLKENPDFKLFLDEVKSKRDVYYAELNDFGKGKELSMEQNYIRLIEAQLRMESFNMVLILCDSFKNIAKHAKSQIDKIKAQEVE